jgi:UDP-glucose 4-epimerase
MDTNAFAQKRVLITGGLGFIGSHLASAMVERGAEVTIIDSLNPDYGGSLFNIQDIKDRVRVNISDVRDPHSMRYLVQNQDYLFNLAGQTSHVDSMSDPRTDLEINAAAQLSILEACRHYNPGVRIVFASTRQLYGKPQYLPVDEKHPLCPVDVNGINKLAGEGYHLLYNNVYGIRASVLRLTNTIGPCMRVKDARQTFVGIWVRLLLEGKPIEVWGGSALRDFTYVDDAVDAFIRSAADERAYGMVFNLGGTAVIDLKGLAELAIRVNGGGSYVVKEYPGERRKIDIGDYYSSYALIQKTLGWQPTTSVEEALKRTFAFYREHLQQYR